MPQNRTTKLNRLLTLSGWLGATREPLAGDASQRKYERLTRADGVTSILMDAPPKHCGSSQPFLTVVRYLQCMGVSVPEIIVADLETGYILMEDFGDALFSQVAGTNRDLEKTLYDAAVALLVKFHETSAPQTFEPYTPVMQADLASLSLQWYGQKAFNNSIPLSLVTDFHWTIRGLISNLTNSEIFTHRDFHAENLIWLPNRKGIYRVGILDFQDAMRFHSAYDLVSILQDARRDVAPELQQRCIHNYCQLMGKSEEQLLHDMAVCGAQRNLRIIGIFTRLALRDGKINYLELLPRVWGYLEQNLSHPSLSGLAKIVNKALSPPTNQVLNKLRRQGQ